MTLTTAHPRVADADSRRDRFRLHRAGILNVWQYDDQEFLLGDGRMLLRGANGAGKSKTLEMLLPFALDGDKARITASARHHTSLLWLMTDGYEGQARVGYIWVEFLRRGADGQDEAYTCGVGIRASASARTASAWFFTTPRRVGHDLRLEDEGGPLSRPRLEEELGTEGQVFQQAAAYKEHVGRTLFGLDVAQYDEVLRLLYWLRQPQVGEDIEPARLAGQLAQALPQLDEHAVKAAGDTFDELTAYGEQIDRRAAAAEALTGLAGAHARYARAVVATRARAVVDAQREERRLRSAWRRADTVAAELRTRREETRAELESATRGAEHDRARIEELGASPEARDQRRLSELADLEREQGRAAQSAVRRLTGAANAHERRTTAHVELENDLRTRLEAGAETARDLEQRARQAGLEPAPRLTAPAGVPDAEAALEGQAADLERARFAVGHRQAAVSVVRESLDALTRACADQERAEQRAEEAEARWESVRTHRREAEAEAEAEAAGLLERLVAWAAADHAPPIELPTELSVQAVDAVPAAAAAAAGPGIGAARAALQEASTARDNAATRIAELTATRAEIEAERDPAPPPPPLRRDPRPDGGSLWQLVDFADELDPEARAGLEAALQSSGLLDAWLRPDGRLIDRDGLNVLLAPGAALSGRGVADVLRPDVPDDAGVSSAEVLAVLRGIGLGDRDALAWVDVDGSWRLGQLHGRAAKERAQFIGATARAQERARQLAEIDDAIAERRRTLSEAERAVTSAEASITGLENWLAARPPADALLSAWTRADERARFERQEERANAEAQEAAHRARVVTSRARDELTALAAQHSVPDEPELLAALSERLRGLDNDLRQAAREIGPLRRDLVRWASDAAALQTEVAALADQRDEADAATAQAEELRARLAELRDSVGAGVRELEARLQELRGSRQTHESAATAAQRQLEEVSKQEGVAEEAERQAAAAVEAHATRRADLLGDLTAVADVPGLLESAGAGDTPAGDDTAAALAGLAGVAEEADPSIVWRAYTDATSGPGADHEPTVSEYADVLAVTARDESGEGPVARVAGRVTAAVERDRELLTSRERERFEQHILGELGDAVRRCRVEAEELVTAMNGLLSGVTTSQGIRVRLDWKLRDDVPPEASEAVRLLGQPVGALLPEERASLRDSLHRLIETSRAERPELSYGEHLAAALDYRSWFAFKIRYTRPEGEGSWLELHRRSPLSQGEQKVLCYLPLFAAAAAHFTSLAGAAPHAPRLVLLDDAFPKIDARTHPLLFGLLVDLDLDFVITSERLWGDHETVPSLAIYEALRDPSQRGIAQFEYRWDGRQLRSLG